ncbi:MAG: adenylate kinase family protein [Candidatus Woesearchaeota archaeon]
MKENMHLPIILISGTPGTGKSTLAKYLSEKLTFYSINCTQLVKEKRIASYFDKRRECYVVDVKKLNSTLKSEILRLKKLTSSKKLNLKGIIIDSHLSHFFPEKETSLCIICKCPLPILRKRLESRGYSKDKVRENLDAEIFEVCLQEAIENGHTIIEVDTSKPDCLVSTLKKVKTLLNTPDDLSRTCPEMSQN